MAPVRTARNSAHVVLEGPSGEGTCQNLGHSGARGAAAPLAFVHLARQVMVIFFVGLERTPWGPLLRRMQVW